MADKTTYIKIDRNILSWGWYKSPKILSVFIWLIIRANIKKIRFEKDVVPRGSLVTSNAHIAEECGLTIDNVRVALANLESTGEITRERRNKYQIITVVNYEAYQSGIIKSGHQIPIKSQSNPDQIPIKSQQYKNKRIKEWEERKKEKGRSAPDSPSGIPERGTNEFRRMSHILLGKDEGTVDDIPFSYRDQFKTFADYWGYKNQ